MYNREVKLYSIYTDSHAQLFEQWFEPSIQDDFQRCFAQSSVKGSGSFMSDDWSRVVLEKTDYILAAIDSCWNDSFIYSDVDIQFFSPIQAKLCEEVIGRDIVFQLDHPLGGACSGFFVCKANQATKKFWQRVRADVVKQKRDQDALQRILKFWPGVNWGVLPQEFFGAGCGLQRQTRLHYFAAKYGLVAKPPAEWLPGVMLDLPANIVMHHANFTKTVANKIEQLRYVKELVCARSN